MNYIRRHKLKYISKEIEFATHFLDVIIQQENEAYNNLPLQLFDTETAIGMCETIEDLEYISDGLKKSRKLILEIANR